MVRFSKHLYSIDSTKIFGIIEHKKERKQMTYKQQIMNQVSDAQKKMTDLLDMLEDGVPEKKRKAVLQHISDLSDFIFYTQEYLTDLA